MKKKLLALLTGCMIIMGTITPAYASSFTLGNYNGSNTLTKSTNSATGKTSFAVGYSANAYRYVGVTIKYTISGGLCRPVSGSLLGDFPSAESSEHTDRYRNLPENKKKQITELDVGYAIGDLFPVFYRRTGCLFTIGNEYEEYFSFSSRSS